MVSETLPLRDPVAVIEDGVPPLSATEDVLWWKIHLFWLLFRAEMTLWSLLQADCIGVSYVVDGVVNQEMGGVTPRYLNHNPVGSIMT
ncbi:hypothetical protein Hanom_Chr02g00178031 [Helianthus anomalus]